MSKHEIPMVRDYWDSFGGLHEPFKSAGTLRNKARSSACTRQKR